jgi:hypothetical protein
LLVQFLDDFGRYDGLPLHERLLPTVPDQEHDKHGDEHDTPERIANRVEK